MISPRTLADRLEAVRTRAAGVASAPTDDRVGALARWFDARTEVTLGGTALVIERSVAVPPGTVEALRAHGVDARDAKESAPGSGRQTFFTDPSGAVTVPISGIRVRSAE